MTETTPPEIAVLDTLFWDGMIGWSAMIPLMVLFAVVFFVIYLILQLRKSDGPFSNVPTALVGTLIVVAVIAWFWFIVPH